MKRIVRFFKKYYEMIMACFALLGLLASAMNLILQVKEEDALGISVNVTEILLFIYFSVSHTLRHVRKRNRIEGAGN